MSLGWPLAPRHMTNTCSHALNSKGPHNNGTPRPSFNDLIRHRHPFVFLPLLLFSDSCHALHPRHICMSHCTLADSFRGFLVWLPIHFAIYLVRCLNQHDPAIREGLLDHLLVNNFPEKKHVYFTRLTKNNDIICIQEMHGKDEFLHAIQALAPQFRLFGTFIPNNVIAGGSAISIHKNLLPEGAIVTRVVTWQGRDHICDHTVS